MSCMHTHSSLQVVSWICSRPAPVRQWRIRRTMVACKTSSADAAEKYAWQFDRKPNPHIRGDLLEIPVTAIRRPLGRTRSNDPDKVQALIDSIQEIGLKEPIDILEVDGKYYGFSGCHRYEITEYAHTFTAGISAVGYRENPMQGPKSKPKYSEDAHDVSKAPVPLVIESVNSIFRSVKHSNVMPSWGHHTMPTSVTRPSCSC